MNELNESPRPESRRSAGRNSLLFIGGLFVLGLALAFLLFGGGLFQSRPRSATANLPQVPAFDDSSTSVAAVVQSGAPLNVGDAAHDFTLQDLDGNTVQLSALRGQPVIVNFWATWCAPCRIEMPELQEAYTAHAGDGLAILAVNQMEEPTAVRTFFRDEMGLTFTPVMDTEGTVADQYGAIGLPSTFFIDADGVVTAVHRGVLTREQIDAYLADILPQ